MTSGKVSDAEVASMLRLIVGLAALFLCMAGFLKFLPGSASPLYSVPSEFIGTFDMFVGGLLWLVPSRSFRAFSGVVFSVYGTFSLVRFVSGFSSCGCLGAIESPPILIAATDFIFAIALFWSCLATKSATSDFRSVGMCGAFCMGTVVFLGFFYDSNQQNSSRRMGAFPKS